MSTLLLGPVEIVTTTKKKLHDDNKGISRKYLCGNRRKIKNDIEWSERPTNHNCRVLIFDLMDSSITTET